MNEVWKTVVIDGIENSRYQVSNLGRVKCKWIRGGEWKICKLGINRYGYNTITIDGKKKSVHRIVAETFIPNPQNKPCIDHIDTNRQRNVIEVNENGVPIENSTLTNIRWCTYSENNNNHLTIKKRRENANMLGKFGAEHNRSIPTIQLTLNGQFIKKWYSSMDIQRELGIDSSSIIKCCKGKLKKTHGFRWMYYDDWLKVCKKRPQDIKPLF